jgi:hypothetical protein
LDAQCDQPDPSCARSTSRAGRANSAVCTPPDGYSQDHLECNINLVLTWLSDANVLFIAINCRMFKVLESSYERVNEILVLFGSHH